MDNDFDLHSKVLKFIASNDRHFSSPIAHNIEKQLKELDLYDKLVTITADGASNMKDMFTYFTRRNVNYIQCIAHKLHLIICNGLKLWTSLKKNRKKAVDAEVEEQHSDDSNDSDSSDSEIRLSQMVRTMSCDDDWPIDDTSEAADSEDISKVR